MLDLHPYRVCPVCANVSDECKRAALQGLSLSSEVQRRENVIGSGMIVDTGGCRKHRHVTVVAGARAERIHLAGLSEDLFGEWQHGVEQVQYDQGADVTRFSPEVVG